MDGPKKRKKEKEKNGVRYRVAAQLKSVSFSGLLVPIWFHSSFCTGDRKHLIADRFDLSLRDLSEPHFPRLPRHCAAGGRCYTKYPQHQRSLKTEVLVVGSGRVGAVRPLTQIFSNR